MKIAGFTIALCLSTLSLAPSLAGCGGSGESHLDQGLPGHADLAMAPPDLTAASSSDMAPAPDMAVRLDDMATTMPGLDGGAPPIAAQVRFVNAASARLTGKDANMLYGFDVYRAGDTTPLVSNLGFGQSSGWIMVTAAAGIKFDLRNAGDPVTSAPLFTTADADALDLSSGGHASLVVYGISKINTTGGFKILSLMDGFTSSAGSAAARFVNVATVNSAYKVYLDPNGAPTVQVAANAATPATGVALPAGGDLPVLIVNGASSSTMFPASTDATWTLPAALVAGGKQLLLILTGQGLAHPRDADAVVLIVVDDKASTQVLKQNPLLFVVGAAPAGPSIDLQTNASKVQLTAIQYKVMKHLSLPAGAGATINGSSMATPLFTSATGPLVSGERYVGVIAGTAPSDMGTSTPDAALQLRVYQEQFAPAAAMTARLRIINEAPGAPALDVGIYYTAGVFTPIQAAIAFPSASDPAGVQAAQKSSTMTTLSFGVGPSGDATALLPFSYVSQFDVDDPLLVIPAGDWSAAAANTAKKVLFVKAPIKSAWQASGPN